MIRAVKIPQRENTVVVESLQDSSTFSDMYPLCLVLPEEAAGVED